MEGVAQIPPARHGSGAMRRDREGSQLLCDTGGAETGEGTLHRKGGTERVRTVPFQG